MLLTLKLLEDFGVGYADEHLGDDEIRRNITTEFGKIRERGVLPYICHMYMGAAQGEGQGGEPPLPPALHTHRHRRTHTHTFGQPGSYLWFSSRTYPFQITKRSRKRDIFKISNAFPFKKTQISQTWQHAPGSPSLRLLTRSRSVPPPPPPPHIHTHTNTHLNIQTLQNALRGPCICHKCHRGGNVKKEKNAKTVPVIMKSKQNSCVISTG